MLSRRLLRIKVLQALYAYMQSENLSVNAAIANLNTSLQKTFQLYLHLLQLFLELVRKEEQYRTDRPKKLICENEIAYYRSLIDVPYISSLTGNQHFSKIKKANKISWQNDQDTLEKLYYKLRNSKEYQSFVESKQISEDDSTIFGAWLFREIIAKSDILRTNIEEHNIFWADSLDVTLNMLYKKLKDYDANKNFTLIYSTYFKDEDEDSVFIDKLFKQVIEHSDSFDTMIAEKAKNWELDRIALIDIILLKMALTEILHFPTIPPKVSINEYIDISKDYSTPKSRIFINGIIDKLMHDLKSEGKVVKTGRGLIE